MHLRDKLYSITPETTVAEVSQLLDIPHTVAIDWLGRRVVKIEGFEGSVEIYEMAEQYLKAAPFNYINNPTLQDRLACYDLGTRVHRLYIQSNTAIENTLIYKYWIPSIEAADEDPTEALLSGFNFDVRRNPLLSFTSEQYELIGKPSPASKTHFVSLNRPSRDSYTISIETLWRMALLGTAVS